MKIESIRVEGDTGKVYTIDTDEHGHPRCSCPAFIYSDHASPCKHMLFVNAHTRTFADA